MNLAEQTRKLTEDFIGSQTEDVRTTIQQAFEDIMAKGYAAHALKEGDQAVDFQLPNVRGGTTRLYGLVRTKSPRVGSLQTPSLVSALRVACCASLLAPGKMVDSVPGHHIF